MSSPHLGWQDVHNKSDYIIVTFKINKNGCCERLCCAVLDYVCHTWQTLYGFVRAKSKKVKCNEVLSKLNFSHHYYFFWRFSFTWIEQSCCSVWWVSRFIYLLFHSDRSVGMLYFTVLSRQTTTFTTHFVLSGAKCIWDPTTLFIILVCKRKL